MDLRHRRRPRPVDWAPAAAHEGRVPRQARRRRAMAEMLQTLDEGTYVARDPQTLGEWIERWLETMKPKIRESTWRDYRNGLRRVSDRLGQVPLQSLRPLDVEELYADLLREGRRYGGGLAPKTVRNIHIALRRSLADAHRFGLVSRNVAALVKPPVPGRSELATWTADEVRAFLDAVGDDRLMPAYRLLAATGMRRGEALGLRWSDVDLDGARVVVDRSLTLRPGRRLAPGPHAPRSDGTTGSAMGRVASHRRNGAPRRTRRRHTRTARRQDHAPIARTDLPI